jgi:hypothetical protein
MSGSPGKHDDLGLAEAIRRAKLELKEEKLLPTLADRGNRGFVAATWIGTSRGVQAVWQDKWRIVRTGLSHAPLVLAIILFLFITAEVWEFFGAMGRDRYFVILGLFAIGVIGALIVAIWGQKSKAVEVATRSGSADLEERAGRTSTGPTLIEATRPPVPEDRRNTDFKLTGVEQWNVLVVFASPFLFIVLFVALVWFLAFLVLGFVGVDLALTKSWTKLNDVSPLIELGLIGENVVTEPLLRVGGVLCVLAGLTFVVEVIRTTELSKELLEDPCEEMSNLIALWVYCKHNEEANPHLARSRAREVRDGHDS